MTGGPGPEEGHLVGRVQVPDHGLGSERQVGHEVLILRQGGSLNPEYLVLITITLYLGRGGVVHSGLDGDPLWRVEHHPEDAGIVLDPPDGVLHPLGQLLDLVIVFAL